MIKIIVVALVFAIIIVYLQSVNKEIAMMATIASGVIILISIVDYLYEVFSLYEQIATLGNINGNILKIIIKVTLVCYVIEFAVGLIEDFGLKSLADKVSLCGKLIIILMATPIITSVITLIQSLII